MLITVGNAVLFFEVTVNSNNIPLSQRPLRFINHQSYQPSSFCGVVVTPGGGGGVGAYYGGIIVRMNLEDILQRKNLGRSSVPSISHSWKLPIVLL